MNGQPLRLYRSVSLALAASFAAVGLIFLLLPRQLLEFFNRLSPRLGLPPAPVQPGSFFPVLALAYMVLVTCLAAQMFRRPGERTFPPLLAQGKLASSILSLVFFFGQAPYLACLVNAAVDGAIAALAWWLHSLQKKHGASWPT